MSDLFLKIYSLYETSKLAPNNVQYTNFNNQPTTCQNFKILCCRTSWNNLWKHTSVSSKTNYSLFPLSQRQLCQSLILNTIILHITAIMEFDIQNVDCSYFIKFLVSCSGASTKETMYYNELFVTIIDPLWFKGSGKLIYNSYRSPFTLLGQN